jgi:Protein of unknown function (DUF3800)
MFLYYLDESYDSKFFVLSALRIRSERFREIFEMTKDYRRNLRDRFGLYISKELHATELVAGRGKYAAKEIGKYQRTQIFANTLHFITTLPEVEILNVLITVPGCPVDPHLRAFERLLNRIQASLEEHKTEGLLILDEGKEGLLRKIARQMSAINFVPSKYGSWDDGKRSKNIKTLNIVEDPLFKTSHSSYFLQFADLVAFSLLKKETPPTAKVAKYGLQNMFDSLRPVLCLKASVKDPLGVVRG